MMPAHILRLLLGTLALRRFAAAQTIGNSTHGSAGAKMPGRRQMELEEVTFTFGVSMSTEHDVIRASMSTEHDIKRSSMKCFYCPDAAAGLEYWKSQVNTNLVTDSIGRKVFVELITKLDHGQANLVQQNYEELASQKNVFALFGPSWVGFNDVAARAAAKYDKALIIWAFDPFNYYSTPGPTLSTADLPPGMPYAPLAIDPVPDSALFPLTSDTVGSLGSQFGRRVRGECMDESCNMDEVPGMSSPNNDTILDDELVVIPETSSYPSGRRLDASLTDFPCKPTEFMRNPLYVTCNATPDAAYSFPFYEWHSENPAQDHAQDWTTLMMFPAGITQVSISMVVTIERSSKPIEDHVALKLVSMETGECIFGLLTEPMQREPGGCKQITICAGTTARRQAPCVQLPNDAAAFANIEDADANSGKQVMVFQVRDDTVPEDMILMIRNERAANWNVTMSHGDVSDCAPSTLATKSGCTPCRDYDCPRSGVYEQYPMCFGNQRVECTKWPDPDGIIWERGYTNIVDINVPETRWAYDAIDRILRAGAENLVFFYVQEAATPPLMPAFGSVSWQRQCSQLGAYAEELSGKTYDVVKFELPPRIHISDYVMQMRSFSIDWKDHAIIICAELPSVIDIVISMKAFQLEPTAIVADRPLDASFVQAVFGYNALSIVEALPMTYNKTQKCVIFDNRPEFEEHFSDFTPSEGFLSYAALQTATAGSIFVRAITMLPHDSLTTNAVMQFLKTSTIETCFGALRFDDVGRRIVQKAGTRQIQPLPDSVNEVVRYYQARIPVLDDALAATCSSDEPCAYGTLRYNAKPALTWTAKQVTVYPCDPGCSFKGQVCIPCPKGKFRDFNDYDCQPCPAGKFAFIPGSSVCKDCMKGAFCSDPTKIPIAKANFYPVLFEGNQSDEDDANWSMIPGPQCVNPNRVESVVYMFACIPVTVCPGLPLLEHRDKLMDNPVGQLVVDTAEETGWVPDSICVGRNKGAFCAQCDNGWTMSPLYGLRECKSCPSLYVPAILTVLTVVTLLGVAKCMSLAGYASARQVSLVAPMLRIMIQHVHIWGAVSENCYLDADPIAAVLMVPVDLLCRPLNVCMGECFQTADAIQNTRSAIWLGKWIYPISIAFLLFVHCVDYTFSSIFAAIVALLQYLRQRSQELVGKQIELIHSAVHKAVHEHEVDQPRQCAECNTLLEKGENFCRKCGWVMEDASSAEGDGEDKEKSQEADKVPREENNTAFTKTNGETGKQIIHPHGERWSRLHGPGASFVMKHGYFYRMKTLRNFSRELVVLLLLLFPICLRIFMRAVSCRRLEVYDEQTQISYFEERWTVNYEVLCGTAMHKSITSGSEIAGIVLVIVIPLLVGLISFVYIVMEWLDSITHREVAFLLFDGYQPSKIFWSAVMWLRTALIIYFGSIENPFNRRVAFLLIVACVFVLTVIVQPWESTCRRALPNYDMYSSIAVMLLVLAGIQSPYELESAGMTDEVLDLNRGVERAIIVVAVLINYCVLIYGFLLLFFFTVLTKLAAVIQHSETDVDRASKYVYQFARWTFGLNGVAHMTNAGHQIICVSRLSEGERQFIVQSIAETVNACIDSSTKFYTWLLENAIKKAFERAVEARRAKLGALYAKWGTRTFSLVNLGGVFNCLRVTLRPPDIQSDVTGVKEVELTFAGPQWWKMEMGRTPEHWRSAVTVQELHDALTSVSYDVMEHHPELHRDPTGHHFVKPEEIARRQEEQHKLQVHVPVWHQATDWKGFEGELLEQGVMAHQLQTAESSHMFYKPDEDLWQQMEDDTQEFRETNIVGTEKELESELSTLENRILELRKQLEEAGDTAALALEKDEDDGKISPDSLVEPDRQMRSRQLTDEEEVKEVSMSVNIISGKNLRNADIGLDNKSDPYCLCSLKDRPESLWRTRTERNTLNPVWNQTQVMSRVTKADQLDFVVMDDDSAGFKSIVKNDDLIGHAFISGSCFWEDGFTGDLALQDKKGVEWGEIRVAISIVDQDELRARDRKAMSFYKMSQRFAKLDEKQHNKGATF